MPANDKRHPMHALTVARTFFRLGLLNFMRYRAYFFVALLNLIIPLGTQLLGLQVTFWADQ